MKTIAATAITCAMVLLEGCATRCANPVNAEATVLRFLPQAMHEHYDDGQWATFDAVELKMTAPREWQGKQLIVYCAPGKKTALPQTAGARCAFTINREYLLEESTDPKTGRTSSHTPFDGALVGLREINP